MDTIKISHGNTQIIAHRGVSGIETENTCAAFVAAGNRSYFGIETDVRQTLDGKFVLLHDDTTERCAGDCLIPEKCTLQTLQSLRLLDKGDTRSRSDLRFPSLAEYLRICKRYDKVGVLEFKGEFSPAAMKRLIEEVETEYAREKMIFISFSFENLLTLRNVCPKAHAQFLSGECKEETVSLVKEHNMGLDLYYNALDEQTVKRLLKEGIELNCWTVDDPEIAERLIRWGVQYITSNILE